MSTDRHDAVDCGAIQAALDAFIDGEDSALDRALIQQHLLECGPCLQAEQVDKIIKDRVARACRDEHCSEQVRLRVMTRLREFRVQTSDGGVLTTTTTVTSFTETS